MVADIQVVFQGELPGRDSPYDPDSLAEVRRAMREQVRAQVGGRLSRDYHMHVFWAVPGEGRKWQDVISASPLIYDAFEDSGVLKRSQVVSQENTCRSNRRRPRVVVTLTRANSNRKG